MDGLPEDLRTFLKGHFEMPQTRWDKCATMYRLAREALTGGVIVEMGAWHGNGTISLCYGTADGNDLKVHTIDKYENWSDWIGANYSREDLSVFTKNIMDSGFKPTLHISTFEKVGIAWKEPISLLVWDGGYSNPKKDIALFAKHLIKGGILAVRETFGQITFNALEICNEYAQNGFAPPEWAAGGFYVTGNA